MSRRHVHSIEQAPVKVSFEEEICIKSAVFITYVRYDMLLNNNALTSLCTTDVLMFRMVTSSHDVLIVRVQNGAKICRETFVLLPTILLGTC